MQGNGHNLQANHYSRCAQGRAAVGSVQGIGPSLVFFDVVRYPCPVAVLYGAFRDVTHIGCQ